MYLKLIIKYDLIRSQFKSIKQHRRGRGIWIKAVKKEIYNIAQNQSFVQKGIGVKYRIPGSGIPFKS